MSDKNDRRYNFAALINLSAVAEKILHIDSPVFPACTGWEIDGVVITALFFHRSPGGNRMVT